MIDAAEAAAIDRQANQFVNDGTLTFDEKIVRIVALGYSRHSAGEMIAAKNGDLEGVRPDGTAWRA